jgi:hypothetical protein
VKLAVLPLGKINLKLLATPVTSAVICHQRGNNDTFEPAAASGRFFLAFLALSRRLHSSFHLQPSPRKPE